MQKVVINHCFGGFGVSKAAAEWCAARGNSSAAELLKEKDVDTWYPNRQDKDLIACIEEKGSEFCSGSGALLGIVEIPDDVGDNWHIHDYDGVEHIAENHRTWS